MPPNRSYLSPPSPGGRKPGAMAPRTTHDYNLLAATVACLGVPPSMISLQFGFEEDYADRLIRSGPGRAFTDWMWLQPEEFRESFQVSFDSETEAETHSEEFPRPVVDQPADPTEEALRALGFTSRKPEDT